MPLVQNLRRTLADGLKSLTWTQSNWVNTDAPGNIYSSWSRDNMTGYHIPGEHLNYAQLVGPMFFNSAYMACLSAILKAWIEAPACIKITDAEGNKVIDPKHPLLPLFEDLGHDHYDDSVMWSVVLTDYLGHGNGYLLPEYTKGGEAIALHYAPWCRLKPIPRYLPDIAQPLLDYYEYTIGINRYKVPVEDVINFQFGADPEFPWLGLGRGDALIRDIFQDNEASSYSSSMLRNWGLAGKIVSPKDIESARDFNGKVLIEMLAAQTKGEKRGSSIAFDRPLDIFEPSTSPEKMAIDKIRQYPESRVCAVMGVPQQVAGLLVGNTSKTFNNYIEARRAFWEDSILPDMRRFGRQCTRQLIQRHTSYKNDVYFGYDYSQVRALQDDSHKVKATAIAMFESTLWDAARALTEVGDKPKPEDDGRMYTAANPLTEGKVLQSVNQAKSKTYEPDDPFLVNDWISRIEAEQAELELVSSNGVH